MVIIDEKRVEAYRGVEHLRAKLMDTHKFEECDPPATEAEIEAFEESLGFDIPPSVRRLFTFANGGRPLRRTFGKTPGNFEISECLALRAGKGSIQRTYEILVRQKHAAPHDYLPFADISGGNALFVNCSKRDLPVFLLTHEPTFRLIDLGVTWAELWSGLE